MVKKEKIVKNDTSEQKIINILLDQNSSHADYFAKMHKKILKVTRVKGGRIFKWNTKTYLWDMLEDDRVETIITDFLKKIYDDSIKYLEKNDSKTNKIVKSSLAKKYNILANVIYANAVWKRAKTLLIDETFLNKVNKEKNMLPISNNNIINLKTGVVRKRTIDDIFTICCDVSFKKDETEFKHAKRFFNDICGKDKDYVKYMVKYLGYCLTGHISDRSFGQLFGFGKNGKSTVVDLMKQILGVDKFFSALSPEIFIKSKGNGKGQATSYLMCLQFARFGVFSESEEGDVINAGLIKAITGGDTLTGRDLYSAQISFVTQCKLLVMTNHRLEFNTSDVSITDRLKYFPFDQRFVHNPKKDNEIKADNNFVENLQKKYINEVFTYLVKYGSMKWFSNKFLIIPNVVKAKLKEYIGELDSIKQFIEKFCTVDKSKSTFFIEKNEFREKFNTWVVKTMHLKSKKHNEINNYMTQRDFESKKKGKRRLWSYVGIVFKEEDIDDSDTDKSSSKKTKFELDKSDLKKATKTKPDTDSDNSSNTKKSSTKKSKESDSEDSSDDSSE